MQITFTLLLTLAATLAAASPSPQNRDNRGNNGNNGNRGNNGNNGNRGGEVRDLIDLWTDRDFLGLKYTGRGEYGRCENLPQEQENRVSSAKARRGHRCTLYDNRGCRGPGFSFIDAPRFPKEFNNKANSWKCDRN